MTVKRDIEIVNKLGLHLRAAAQFIQTANRFKSDVMVTKDGRTVNGKSIMGVMTLVATKGSKISVEAKGDDAEVCLDALGALAANKFGEKD
jgi:phosphocarrier protein HPr